MNPPPDEDADDTAPGAGGADYLGAELLDPALADRFPFVAAVPDWSALSEDDRRAILADQFRGRHEFPVPVAEIVAEAKAAFEAACPTARAALSPKCASRRSAARRGTFRRPRAEARSGA